MRGSALVPIRSFVEATHLYDSPTDTGARDPIGPNLSRRALTHFVRGQ